MPVLGNSREEAFAQGIANGLNQSKAYRAAQFVVKSGTDPAANANRLLKKPRIRARVDEILADRIIIHDKATEKAADKLSIDREWVLSKLVENVNRSMQAQAVMVDGAPTGEYRYDGNVANRALELVGKELGMFIERTENRTVLHTISSEPVTPDEWAAEHAIPTAH